MCNARGSCRSRLDDSIRFFVIRSPCSRGYGPPENHPVSLGSLCMMLFGTKVFVLPATAFQTVRSSSFNSIKPLTLPNLRQHTTGNPLILWRYGYYSYHVLSQPI